MNTIQSKWESYLKQCVHSEAEEIQVIETRRAFYGGVASLISLLNVIDEVSEDASQSLVNGWLEELNNFYTTQEEI